MSLLGAFLVMAAVGGDAQATEPSPTVQFLRAADVNDFAVMAKLVQDRDGGISGEALTKKVSNCYLRRVYANNEQNEIIAAWMCAEGKNKSRVVLGSVKDGLDFVTVKIELENRNNRPAPPRNGSAFAEGKE